MSGNAVFLPTFSAQLQNQRVTNNLQVFENFTHNAQTSPRARIKYLEPRLPLVNNQYRLTQFARFFLSQDLLDRIYAEQTSQPESVYYKSEVLFYTDFFGTFSNGVSSRFFGSSLKKITKFVR